MDAPFVTILLTDMVGSTELFDRLGDDLADEVRRRHFAAMRQSIADHGGNEVKSTGDGLMVAFASTVAAVRCAIAMQLACADDGLGVRVGLDAGEPLVEEGDLYGRPVVVATRLCDSAGGGEILVSETVRAIAAGRVPQPIRPAGAIRLKGFADRVAVAQVLWRDAARPPAPTESSTRPITVVIADDQRLLRSGFRVILDAESDITVIGEAENGQSAVDVVRRRRPDVVLMDIRMPEMSGLEAAKRIMTDPDLRTAVLMLTTFDSSEYVYEALRIGASGFLLKDAPADRLLDAVRVAAAGDALLAPSITRRLIEQFTRAAQPAPGEIPEALGELTARELGVLRLIARGMSNAEIAAELVLGENTVKTHVARVLGKLGLRDRVQAVVLAYETGFVSRDAR
jgi:DNA-binding NarL/FixJ family response regulator/class 3 adenylate cyclase